MKQLDAEPLHSGIEYTISHMTELRSQVSRIQRAVRDFVALDGALKGEGGKAIRSFYDEGHQPILIQLHQSFTDYENIITKIQDAILSFEFFQDGFISENFLDRRFRSSK